MKPELKEINEIYIRIEDYFFPAPGYFDDVERHGREYVGRQHEYESLYLSAGNKFDSISAKLTPKEIIEGYEQGCRLLQENLSGWMYHRFDREYIPIMLKAIDDDHGHTVPLFLRALTLYASDLRDELIPRVLKLLSSKDVATQTAAISAAYELQIDEALPIIRELTSDPNPEMREIAGSFLSNWNKK